MITNKDIRVENGNLVLNGDKFPLDGQSPEAIMEIVEDNSDSTPTENSTAPVTSGGVYTALGAKQDTLTFDSAPTDESTNPVTSGGVFTAIGNKIRKLITQTRRYNFTAANTYEYTGINVTCPTGHTYIVSAWIVYSNSEPTGIAASSSSETMRMYDCYAKTEAAAYITFMLTGGKSAYIWGKGTQALGDDINLDIVDITN